MNGRFIKLLTMTALGAALMFGNTVKITLVSAGTSPYTGNVVGIGNGVSIICDDFYDHVAVGESWTATVETLQNVIDDNDSATGTPNPTRFTMPTYTTSMYEQVAWLTLQFATHTADASGIQTAIWHVFDSAAQTVGSLVTDPTSTAYWLDQISGSKWNSTKISYVTSLATTIDIFTPVNGSQSTGGNPQEFLYLNQGTSQNGVPEPSTYAMFGTGLILLSLGTFRRRSKKTN
jgi:hypothetical protein